MNKTEEEWKKYFENMYESEYIKTKGKWVFLIGCDRWHSQNKEKWVDCKMRSRK